ncbi:MAG: nucleoside recognition domain-containing protein [candidate division WOR-3 bacterium]
MIISQYLKGIFNLSLKTFVILLLVFLLLEIIQRSGILNKAIRAIGSIINFMGYKKQSSAPLLAGIILGIIYGAGVIDDMIRQENIDKKQVLLVSVFLAMCHAIFEDTGLFLMLGANLFWITIPRIILAVVVTFIINRLIPDA